MDLFEKQSTPHTEPELPPSSAPLAARMRPREITDIAGQDHLLAPGKLLRRAVESDRLGSIILYGPPGCGKTSLAEVVAGATKRRFERVSGVIANVASLRGILQNTSVLRRHNDRETILFVDEIHHFNKSQQDVLLPYVEDGSVILIGATTHNPFFFINSPLVSRSQIFELNPLDEQSVIVLLKRALSDPERGLGGRQVQVDEDALAHLARVCEGDARRALNALEIAALTTPPESGGAVLVNLRVAEESIQKKAVVYDRDEDGHYDTISAFIKSIRGSDSHAAIYWLAKMLEAGEDPRFIARRLMILASEDIGNADPRALLIANAARDAVMFVGMPEARITLAQAVTYLACAPKSNSAYMAVEKALQDVRGGRVLPVPKPLRGSNYRGAKQLGHTGYRYAHDYDGHVVDQEYIPTSAVYYQPGDQGFEVNIRAQMARCEEIRRRQRKDRAGKQLPGEEPDK